ncbi:MAG: hypothetical protein JWL71_3858 [Acidobacteria bacterium]|nr:hypothetical protein [Acidobacteriota bacterium]
MCTSGLRDRSRSLSGVSIAPGHGMQPPDVSAALTDREQQLENEFIAQYLRSRDCDETRLRELPEQEQHRLLQEASAYASAKLVQVGAARHLTPEAGRDD